MIVGGPCDLECIDEDIAGYQVATAYGEEGLELDTDPILFGGASYSEALREEPDPEIAKVILELQLERESSRQNN